MKKLRQQANLLRKVKHKGIKRKEAPPKHKWRINQNTKQKKHYKKAGLINELQEKDKEPNEGLETNIPRPR